MAAIAVYVSGEIPEGTKLSTFPVGKVLTLISREGACANPLLVNAILLMGGGICTPHQQPWGLAPQGTVVVKPSPEGIDISYWV